jgi:hypothetical protein
MLAPHEPRLATEHRQVDELNLRALLDPAVDPALGADPTGVPELDVHHHRSSAARIDHAEDDHFGESDQQLAHARRVNFHRGSPELDGFDTIKLAEPPATRQGWSDPAHFRSSP